MKAVLQITFTMFLVITVIGTDRYHFCSSHLSDTLELICSSRFRETNQASKRANSLRQIYNSILTEKRSVGIVQECCERPCTVRTLSLYCELPTVFETDQSRAQEVLFSILGQRNGQIQQTTTETSATPGNVPSPTTEISRSFVGKSNSTRRNFIWIRRMGNYHTRRPTFN